MAKGARGGKRAGGGILDFKPKRNEASSSGKWDYRGINDSISNIETQFEKLKGNKRLSADGKQKNVLSIVRALNGLDKTIATEMQANRGEGNPKALMSYRRKARTIKREVLKYGENQL